MSSVRNVYNTSIGEVRGASQQSSTRGGALAQGCGNKLLKAHNLYLRSNGPRKQRPGLRGRGLAQTLCYYSVYVSVVLSHLQHRLFVASENKSKVATACIRSI